MIKYLLTLSVLVSPFIAVADDLPQIFKKVSELVEQKKYPKALDELSWAKKEIEKQNTAQLESYLPDSIGDFKGEKISSNGALGIVSIERNYVKGNDQIKVSLTGTSGSDAAGLGGGLAAFGKMAAMMGGQTPGNETIRVNGKTAILTLSDTSKSGDLSVFLDSGSVLKFEMSDNATADTLKKAAEGIKIEALDTYLAGQ